MKRLMLVALWVTGLALIALGYKTLRLDARRTGPADAAAARAVSARLESYVDERVAAVRELADRFGHWESLPESALWDALRATAGRYLSLQRILVADPHGRLLAGYDGSRPLGQERLARGRFDTVLGRRQVLRSARAQQVLPATQAGTLQQLRIAAVIRRPDGSRAGYVGATLDLRTLRREVAHLAPTRLRLSVTTRDGHLLMPCGGAELRGGAAVRTARFVVRAQTLPKDNLLDFGALTILVLTLLTLGSLALGRHWTP